MRSLRENTPPNYTGATFYSSTVMQWRTLYNAHRSSAKQNIAHGRHALGPR